MKKILLLISFCILISGCGNNKDTKDAEVVMINKDEVVEYMNDGAILIDVRTESEFEAGHIDGSINIGVESILSTDDILVYNNVEIGKNQKVIVYCRSGSRSNKAANKLVELGYTNVYDFGSIDNWSLE